jgi:hypothetical protein
MKKFILLFVAVLAVTFAVPVHSGETMLDSLRVVPTIDDTYGLRQDYPDGTAVWSITRAGVVSGSFTRSIPLPLMSFAARTSSSALTPLSASSSPVMAIVSEVPYAQWADGETPPIVATFRIPDNYKSGGSFKLMATQTATGCQVDFDVYVNRDGTAIDAAATNQTPVLVSATYTTATPALVTLTPATDFSSLVAGDWITLRLWRDDVATETGSLRVHDVSFVYTANQ